MLNSPTVSHRLAMFGVYWSSGNGNISYLIYHVTSQDHKIRVSYDFMGWSSSLCGTSLPSVVAIGIVAFEICF